MALTKPQKKVISNEARFRVLITGRRFGKTFLAINELAKFASKPNQRVWYVAPTYRQAKAICWNVLKEKMIYHKWVKNINHSDLTITLKNNSTITLRGSDNEQSLRGVGLNFLCIDEFADVSQEAWFEVLRPTLSDTKGHALFCGSPRGFGNWSYELFKQGETNKEWASFKYTTIEGGNVDEDEVEQAKQDLDIRTFQQEYEATFVNYSGMIYYNFSRESNIIEKYQKETAILHIGLDFNVDPMSAVVCIIVNETIMVVDEIQIYSSNTQEMCDEIKNRYKNKQIVVYPDPSARQRKTSAGGFTDLSILKNAGFDVKCKNTAPLIRDRINAVNAKLKNVNGKNSLFIVKSCKNVIKSIERQIYKEGTHVPDKDSGYDHMNDALGYLIEFNFPLRRNFAPSQPKRWS
ncbi:terminase large subunit [uncultured Mediterranean phage uvMED]|nr:terminase large subunit [uncultured Mediterranean phage uvMED]BAQ91667.1 terminase large subunit [uncultured Mediterranean phage uvMED]BAQ91758.1 terminase large subunit [uncultured Mediterranean phage uvMED]BAQ91805.1 terminase large subunit [uncultured Mediterranean phage uvMED]BAR20469.1 terminase large subunit [uncultured Mediterranean phage uvMED]